MTRKFSQQSPPSSDHPKDTETPFDPPRGDASTWPALWLEQERLGETTAAHQQRQARLSPPEREARARQVAALARDDAEILARYPAAMQAAKIAARLQSARSAKFRWPQWSWWLPIASMAALALMVWPAAEEPGAADQPALVQAGDLEATRSKGLQPHLVVYRQHAGEVTRVIKDEVVAAHTLVQLAYVAASCKVGAIVSIDGAGQVTLHFPDQATSSAALNRAGGEVLLPAAYELDQAPDFERFIFACSKASGGQKSEFNVRAVMDAAAKIVDSTPRERWSEAPLELPATWLTSNFVLRKEAKP